MADGLTRRPNAPSTNEKDEISTSKKNLIDLKPDYAIKVLYKYNAETKSSDLESGANLKILLKILQLNGFIVHIRPDTNTNFIILFVTLADDAFENLVHLSNEMDKLFDVTTENPTSDDKISIAERLRLIYLKLTLPKTKGGCAIEVGKGNVKGIVPVKNILNIDNEYKSNWKNIGKLFKKNVREENVLFLKENFGTKYAIYYKFVQAYVSSIGCLALAGILAWFFLGNFSKIYAAINIFVGITCYLCVYATERKLSNDWKLKNINNTEVVKLEDAELLPTWKTLLRQFCFIPITTGSAFGLFLTQFACFLVEIFITEIYQGPFKSIFSLIPTILVCVLVPVGTIIYSVLAKQYISFEKNPTKEKENRSLLTKMFAFNCLASYSPLLITSFIYLPLGYFLDPYLQTIKAIISNATSVYTYIPHIETLESQYKVNNARLSGQIFYFMVINQVVGTFVEFVVPIVLSKILNIPKIASYLGTPASSKTIDYSKIDDSKEHEYLELVRSEFLKPEVSIDDDYRQHILQYGFLMLFGPVWTLGALCCFIFGFIQQEGDYIKYIKLSKSVIPGRTESSQPWVSFMHTLLIIGSFVSVSITLMYNNHSDTVEEISSFVGRSSVENSWFNIISGASLSSIAVFITVYCAEQVVDSIYDVNETVKLNKEIKANNLIEKFTKEAGTKTSDVEPLFGEIETYQTFF